MKQTAIFILGLILGAIILGAIIKCSHANIGEGQVIVTRDTVYDTISYRMPIPVDSTVVRYVKTTLQVTNTITDTMYVTVGDSIPVELPITQKIYEDSTYKAWVSGFMPQLDSINGYQATNIVTIVEKAKSKHWGLGVQLGVGITPKKIQPYLGIGVSYNIFSW